MSIERVRSNYTIAPVLDGHTLSEQYFFGYTTSRVLAAELDRVVVRAYGDRNDYVYFRNHHLRAYVENGTKYVEVPSELMAQQVRKVHETIARADRYDFTVTRELPEPAESIYEATESLLGEAIDEWYRALEPTGHVVFCRPEELLVELLRDRLDRGEAFLDEYIESSSRYVRRIDDPDVSWADAHEPRSRTHPKFDRVEQMVETINERASVEVKTATAKAGVFRGYRLTVDGQQFTLLSRGWGRDMTYAMASRLLAHTSPESVLFTGGCGAVQPTLQLNDFVVPEAVRAPGEPPIEFDNAYADDPWVERAIGDATVRGTSHNVDSPTDETVARMSSLREDDVQCVSMENYGIAKALRGTDVPFGVLLFVMDCPLRGVDLGNTNYDPQTREDVTFVGNGVATQVTAGWHGLVSVSPGSVGDAL